MVFVLENQINCLFSLLILLESWVSLNREPILLFSGRQALSCLLYIISVFPTHPENNYSKFSPCGWVCSGVLLSSHRQTTFCSMTCKKKLQQTHLWNHCCCCFRFQRAACWLGEPYKCWIRILPKALLRCCQQAEQASVKPLIVYLEQQVALFLEIKQARGLYQASQTVSLINGFKWIQQVMSPDYMVHLSLQCKWEGRADGGCRRPKHSRFHWN